MQTTLLKDGINYIVKVGRNLIGVKLLQLNADGKTYLVRNLKTGKPFFVKNANAFVDFQNEGEKLKAEQLITEENAPIITKTSKVPNDSKTSKTSKLSKIMGFSKCSFVKALGKNGYTYYHAKKVLDACGISMPDGSIRIQIYFGKKSDLWKKFGKPADLTQEQIDEIEKILTEDKDKNEG